MKVVVKEFKLVPSSLTYAMTLFVKLNTSNIIFIHLARATLKILSASNNPIISIIM
jgi:hypothetical protein